MPFRPSISTAAWCSVVGTGAPTFVALRFRGYIGDVLAFLGVTGDVGVVVWGFVALDVMALVCAARLLVDPYTDSIELVVSIALPWLVGLVGAVGWRHAITSSIRSSVVALESVVSVCFQHMSHNVLVSVVIKHGSPG